MKAPIVVYDSGDILMFESVEAAELSLEAIDVENDEYVAYDSEGRLLKLGVERIKRGSGIFAVWLDKVVISCIETEPNHADDLRRILVDFFARIGLDQDWLSKATLKELVSKGLKDHKAI
jgi:hypothetical protein